MTQESKIGCLLIAGIAALGLSTSMATAEINKHTIRFATTSTEDHPTTLGARKFAELLSDATDGKIQVQIFANGVLGGDTQVLSAMQGGTLEMTANSTGLFASMVPELAVYDLPFLFENSDEVDAITTSETGQDLLAALEDHQLYGATYWDFGFRDMTNSRRPVETLEDFEGLKIRVAQIPIYIDLFDALGVNATPMPFPEVYGGLEQRIIDGQETGTVLISSMKFNEVQDYMTLTRHAYNPMIVAFSKSFWDRLNQDEKDVVTEALATATEYQRNLSRKRAGEVVGELEAAGMTVSRISPTEKDRIRERMVPVIEKYRNQIGADLVDEVLTRLSDLRAAH